MPSKPGISATVGDIDKPQRMITLQLNEGETIELNVPAARLTDLQADDSVVVACTIVHSRIGERARDANA